MYFIPLMLHFIVLSLNKESFVWIEFFKYNVFSESVNAEQVFKQSESAYTETAHESEKWSTFYFAHKL